MGCLFNDCAVWTIMSTDGNVSGTFTLWHTYNEQTEYVLQMCENWTAFALNLSLFLCLSVKCFIQIKFPLFKKNPN